MPEINPVLGQVGKGFAAFLAPPGPEVVRFTVGQPDFDTPQLVVDEAKAALDRGETAYTRPQGSEVLCKAVKDHLMQFEIDVLANDVVVTPGCKQALFYSMMAVLAPGDEVLSALACLAILRRYGEAHGGITGSCTGASGQLPPRLRRTRKARDGEDESHHPQLPQQPDRGRLHPRRNATARRVCCGARPLDP